jgi:F0F1-type ATP synthase epsilon subunit
MPYSSLMDCAKKTFAREGITGFWAGLPTYVVRIAPHVMIVKFNDELNIIFIDFGCLRVHEKDLQVR